MTGALMRARLGGGLGKVFLGKILELNGNVYISAAANIISMPDPKNLKFVVAILQAMKVVELAATFSVLIGAYMYVFVCGCPNILIAGIVVRLLCIPTRLFVVSVKRDMEARALLEA